MYHKKPLKVLKRFYQIFSFKDYMIGKFFAHWMHAFNLNILTAAILAISEGFFHHLIHRQEIFDERLLTSRRLP
jgi:hypothetical protein